MSVKELGTKPVLVGDVDVGINGESILLNAKCVGYLETADRATFVLEDGRYVFMTANIQDFTINCCYVIEGMVKHSKLFVTELLNGKRIKVVGVKKGQIHD